VQVVPEKIRQGDVFLIKVTNAKTGQVPSALLADTELYFNKCGEGCYLALGAIELKSKPGPHILKLKVGNMQKSLKLTVRKGKFPKLKITLPEDKVILSPEDLDRTKRENERLDTIFQTISNKLWDGCFVRPLNNELSTAFGTERTMNGKWVSIHKGVDIKGKAGEEVSASNNGRVILAEGLFFGGNTIILDHGQGIYTIYMHLSKMEVTPGDSVKKGEVIGLVGSSGRSSGPHLHFGAKVMNIPVNPVSLTDLKL
jgi:murein DD-endopeptidase MepM/ murein hydrolase activator NlpD